MRLRGASLMQKWKRTAIFTLRFKMLTARTPELSAPKFLLAQNGVRFGKLCSAGRSRSVTKSDFAIQEKSQDGDHDNDDHYVRSPFCCLAPAASRELDPCFPNLSNFELANLRKRKSQRPCKTTARQSNPDIISVVAARHAAGHL
jgi:hypothetical protein